VYVRGTQKNVSEIDSLRELFEDNLVGLLHEERHLKSDGRIRKMLKESGLHTGEITVIEAAISMGATAVLDDKRARNVARFIGAKLSGTANIVVELVKLGIINKSEAKEGINKMISEGWYCSTRDYAQIINSIESA
jgi:predicted nucleic acid-binding protein